jgi:hypothetical protein
MNVIDIVFTVFWAIIALTYLYLMIKHFVWFRYKHSRLPKRPTIAKISGVPLNIAETVEDINEFINLLNTHSSKVNIAQFWGYLAAFLAALTAFILSLLTLV